jgi:hypothetical protein
MELTSSGKIYSSDHEIKVNETSVSHDKQERIPSLIQFSAFQVCLKELSVWLRKKF